MQSDDISTLLTALYKARDNFKPLEKNGSNSFFKTQNGKPHKFSTLDDIFYACTNSLRGEKLEIFYTTKVVGDFNYLCTTLFHIDSKQWLRSETVIGGANSKPQDIGSGITYMRRYHIQAMLNLEADFEDDGNVASGRNTTEISSPRRTTPQKDIDFDYAGAPYRVFGSSNEISKTFTAIETWGVQMKKNQHIKTDLNTKEVNRVRGDVKDSQDMTENAKAKMLASIDSLGVTYEA
tara:strand:+ start:1492 stop:2199 length:708 start_codon:yes stop_codon:yes gene_type:complete